MLGVADVSNSAIPSFRRPVAHRISNLNFVLAYGVLGSLKYLGLNFWREKHFDSKFRERLISRATYLKNSRAIFPSALPPDSSVKPHFRIA